LNLICLQTIWDVGGQDKIRPLWRHYYTNVDALIYVVDANDKERFELASEELHRLLSEDQLRTCPLLVLANKMDLKTAAPADKVMEALQLTRVRHRSWYVQGCSAISGSGVYEGMDWLSKALTDKKK